ncbi:MKRN2 opposite strand protein isoform X2 [Rhodnius prolixus]|uniref:MKRN2 opposite strand protein isoform X2 n=1 Tax=Rhodnius prolixus TaxID=13249 RepID=UPI003D1885CD
MRNPDPGILCFSHCGPRVFCLQLPEHCPVCRANLDSQQSLVPFRVPYPFVKASQYPCSVVLKPTNGDYLNDYKVLMDLHVGVTTSNGKVIEYDKDGFHSDRANAWTQSLVIHQVLDEDRIAEWDKVLNAVSSQDCWTSQRYNEETFNCYTFVLAFIRCLQNGPISEHAKSKIKFCELYVIPRATNAYKYVQLYRRLKDSGYFVNRPHNMNKFDF